MPIEPAMHGMMNLITGLGNVAVKGARFAGRLNAAAFSPMTGINFIPGRDKVRKQMSGDPTSRTFWLGPPKQYTTKTEVIGSRGGEHRIPGRTPAARKSMRGPSAQRFRRDEERYRRRRH